MGAKLRQHYKSAINVWIVLLHRLSRGLTIVFAPALLSCARVPCVTQGPTYRYSEDGGTTLLHDVVKGHDTTAVAQLCVSGVDVGSDESRSGAVGNTPLITAATRGHTDSVDLLLAAGADPNATNRVGVSALSAACRRCVALRLSIRGGYQRLRATVDRFYRALFCAEGVSSCDRTAVSWVIGGI